MPTRVFLWWALVGLQMGNGLDPIRAVPVPGLGVRADAHDDYRGLSKAFLDQFLSNTRAEVQIHFLEIHLPLSRESALSCKTGTTIGTSVDSDGRHCVLLD